APLARPAFLDDLSRTPQGQGIGGGVVSNNRTRPGIRPPSHAHRRKQKPIAAPESAAPRVGGGVVFAVVASGDGGGGDVGAFTDFCVAKISEMVGLGTFAQARFLGLNKISHVRAFANVAAGTQVRVRSDERAAGDGSFINDAAWPDHDSVGNFRVTD